MTSSSPPPATASVVKYHVNCVPEDYMDAHLFGIDVEHRGRDRWAVTRHRRCLSNVGEWDYESIPSERTDEWLAAHRFDREEALRLAVEQAPLMRVNRWSVADVIENGVRDV